MAKAVKAALHKHTADFATAGAAIPPMIVVSFTISIIQRCDECGTWKLGAKYRSTS